MSDEAKCARQSEANHLNNEEEPSREGLWPGDTGTLCLDSRRALLQLVRGPMISAQANGELWQALLADQPSIESRLADLFLELVVQEDEGIAFVQNAPAVDTRIPKAVRNQPLTLIDTILVLSLRRELMVSHEGRVFVSQEETFASVAQYRPLSKLDEAAFRKRLEGSWSKLVSAGILLKAEGAERFEVSSVLRLIFGAEEVKAVNDAFERMLEEAGDGALDKFDDETAFEPGTTTDVDEETADTSVDTNTTSDADLYNEPDTAHNSTADNKTPDGKKARRTL
ncbi:DUF4194 domain-containing protein [Adlercreutzia sp. ZJ138]|uniref:DUF4194 domain-containing protein n=1 Tax=Adlercreutzia sp. ZJ138 TaxID=2709405 RepID=UPI0013EC3C7E|nr:DUF4194 domain-containing protein [Adlercreutzia sp. ZJ138]